MHNTKIHNYLNFFMGFLYSVYRRIFSTEARDAKIAVDYYMKKAQFGEPMRFIAEAYVRNRLSLSKRLVWNWKIGFGAYWYSDLIFLPEDDQKMANLIEVIKSNPSGQFIYHFDYDPGWDYGRRPSINYGNCGSDKRFWNILENWGEGRGNFQLPSSLDVNYLHKMCVESMSQQFMPIIRFLSTQNQTSPMIEKGITAYIQSPTYRTELSKLNNLEAEDIGLAIFNHFQNPYPMIHEVIKLRTRAYCGWNGKMPDPTPLVQLIVKEGGWTSVQLLYQEGFNICAEQLKFRLLSEDSNEISHSKDNVLEIINEEVKAVSTLLEMNTDDDENNSLNDIYVELLELKKVITSSGGNTLILNDSVVMVDGINSK
jgi:hypothetical protein